MQEVDLYINRFNKEIQQRLQTIRSIALNAFKNVNEKLYYGLPAIAKNGKIFIFYGAYKNHISICVGIDWVDFFKQQYPQFDYTQYTIIFKHGEPFPNGVVQTICELLSRGPMG